MELKKLQVCCAVCYFAAVVSGKMWLVALIQLSHPENIKFINWHWIVIPQDLGAQKWNSTFIIVPLGFVQNALMFAVPGDFIMLNHFITLVQNSFKSLDPIPPSFL